MARINSPHLVDVYREAASRFGDLSAFSWREKSGGEWKTLSYRALYERGLALATALIELGVQPREHVGLLADNRPEWIVCDYGVLLAGAADVPRGSDITELEIAYILHHADVRVVFVEDLAVLERVMQARQDTPQLETIILMEPREVPPEGVLGLADLVERGEALRANGDRRAEVRIDGVEPGDLFTIIYTSGTTGTPKGVQLTHANMASQIRNLPFDLEAGERTLSILPVWHSYERIFEMVSIAMGACTHYTSPRAFADDLKSVRPNLMASAPRLWESLYQKLMTRMESASPLKRALFQAARNTTCAVKRAERFFMGQEIDLTGRSIGENLRRAIVHAGSWLLNIVPHKVLDRIVLAKLREAVGCDDFRGTISGGGALQSHVDEFFNFIGIPVLEGYGLTETSPVLAVRTWKNLVIGTVGAPYPDTEIRLRDTLTGEIVYPDPKRRGRGRGHHGEIEARGPQIMRGYYKDPATTARVLQDGWLKTGDLGMITFNDCLKIVGRCKDTIVLLNGENVEPVPIESRLAQSPLVEQCMVVGQDRKQLGALIVPSLEAFRSSGIEAADRAALAANPEVRALLERDIRLLISHGSGFKSFERIGDFRIISKAFEPGKELTATLKVKRHVITEMYNGLIAEMAI